jgi:hypothetical protein
MDPTNPVAYARHVPADIAGRPAFVLRLKNPGIEMIPELSSESFRVEKDLVYQYQKDRTLRVNGKLRVSGRAAIPLTQKSFYQSVESVKYDVIHSMSFGYKMLSYEVGEFAPASRLVRDLQIPFRFTLADIGVRTSAGYGFLLMREPFVDKILKDTKGRMSDLQIETPGVWVNREEVVGFRRVGESNLDCDLQSEWMNASRVVSETSTGVVSSDRIEVLKEVIPNEDLHSPEFEQFQSRLRECFFRAAIIIEPRDLQLRSPASESGRK